MGELGDGCAFEDLKLLQSCKVAGGRGSPGYRLGPGHCAGWLDTMPRSRHRCSYFTGEGSED